VAAALRRAEGRAAPARRAALTDLAAQLRADAATAGDPTRVQRLAETVSGLAAAPR
jgi:hypothetical protein